MTDPPSVAADEELDRLDHLARRFEDDARDVRSLARGIRRLRAGRADGRSWHEMVDTHRPVALQLVDRAVRRVAEGSAALRRLLVRGLRSEGATTPGIAHLLGVSHQRVSVLLRDGKERRTADDPRD